MGAVAHRPWRVRVAVLAGIALLSLAVFAGLRSSSATDAAGGAVDRASEAHPAGADLLPTITEPVLDAARATVEPAPTCILSVTVRERGELAPGRLSWLQARHCHRLMAGLSATVLPGSRDDPRARHEDIDGRARIELQSGEWMWLRFQRRDGPLVFHRVPPLAADEEVAIDLTASPRVHVQVVGSDWWTPVPHAHVRVYSGSAPQDLAAVRTEVADAAGYLVLTGLQRGRVVVASEGSEPQDGPPYACPVIVGGIGNDVGLVLVQGAVPHDLRVTALVVGTLTSPVPPKLYLERIAGTRERLYPQQGVLKSGPQELRFRVPAGVYGIGVAPAGEVEVQGGPIEVSGPGATASLSIVAATERVAVRLQGPGLADPPLRVLLEPTEGLCGEDPDLMFAGPFHWSSCEATLPRSARPRVVNCLGRHRAFVSAAPVVFGGAHAAVDLVPACCITVEWQPDDALPPGEPVLVATTAQGVLARLFERAMVECPAGRTPALRARIVVPMGEVQLEAMVGEQSLWRRDATAAGRHLLVTVASTRS